MAIRDVTELLRVDTNAADADSVDQAVARIRAGLRAVVVDDRYAVTVLTQLGLSTTEATRQVDWAHGPMRNA